MSKILDIHKFLKGIADYLRSDTILQGSNYLDGTNNIFLKRLPENKKGNNLIIEAGNIIPDDMYNYHGEVKINCLFELLPNGQVDYRADKVLNRCEELIDEHSFNIPGIIVTWIASAGVISNVFDAFSVRNQSSNKSHGVLRIKVIVSNNS